ncbi:MAG: sugar ABC transporter ATP-binding protein [Alphaproteobacteria bacterium]|nr:sugar ABC transporter ATP-binding protein [Alphaproteobacteria bacterium]
MVPSNVATETKTGTSKADVPALVFRHLSKSFGGAKALDDVEFHVDRGEVHGLLGQNGSGKSTLIKVLAGYHDPDNGELEIYGRRIPLPLVPGEYLKYGLGFVHQNLGLVPSLTVLENLIAGALATKARWYIDWRAEAERALETFARFRLDFDPDAIVGALPQVQQALLAIVRAFEEIRAGAAEHGTPGILILDEPTPFLPREGVERLFELIRDIVSHGASVVFVSHDVDEVMEITDRATVLRDGKVAGVIGTKGAERNDFIEKIIGRRIDLFTTERVDRSASEVTAHVAGLTGGPIANLDLVVHRGEVVGLTGLIGSGYEHVPYLMFGARPASGGTLALNGLLLSLPAMNPYWAVQLGIALLPGDRQGASGVGTLPIEDNVTLPVLDWFRRGLGLERRGMRAGAAALGQAYEVRPNRPDLNLDSLSGGNQQKVLLAKWMQSNPDLLLLDEPTQGVDVGARQAVFKAVRAAADQGLAVICASSDHEQLAAICDRVLVFARGRVVSELTGNNVTKDRITEQCYASATLQG